MWVGCVIAVLCVMVVCDKADLLYCMVVFDNGDLLHCVVVCDKVG